MPFAPLRPCTGSLTCPRNAVYRGRCAEHARVKEQDRYNADTRKWYSTPQWNTLRQLVKARDIVCVVCGGGIEDIDHITPHRGVYEMFFNINNLQGMCKHCHGQKTKRGE